METKEKKQVVAAITKATNILITVGVDPTVDELSALLGLTLLLGKLDKHATAVFSGNIPPAIAFLDPTKTFEDTVDGLRDFIIALNKDKADHLRYKLDGDVVKIFITPYKNTIIRDTDLEFSQGDFNVDLILALGVENKADLDVAVASHGRILHDATTITLSAGATTSDLGEVDWHAASASSLGEMLVSLSRDLGENLIDEHIATAFMTGIVSTTERFSNNLTTSDVMKTAAGLMALGANQQLIAAQLQEAEEPTPEPEAPKAEPSLEEKPDDDEATVGSDGTMQINHRPGDDDAHDDKDDEAEIPQPTGPSLVDVEREKDEVLQKELDKVIPSANVDLDELKSALPKAEADELASHAASAPQSSDHHFIAKTTYDDIDEPTLGGTLNATTEQAEEESRAAIEDDRNRVILSHDAPAAKTDVIEPSAVKEQATEIEPAPEVKPAPTPEPTPTPEPIKEQPSVEEALKELGYPAGSHPTLADLDEKTHHDEIAPADEIEKPVEAAKSIVVPVLPIVSPAPVAPALSKPPLEVDDARAAVATALDSVFTSANNPDESIGSQPLSDDIHAAPAPVAAPTPVITPTTTVAPMPTSATAISLPPLPPLPPLPGQPGGLPPLPPLPEIGELDAHAEEHATESKPQAPDEDDWVQHTVEPPSNDPTQFHIPGQQ